MRCQLTIDDSPSYAPTADRAWWVEIRAYKNYMVIGSELEGHGVQIFDMKKVRASPILYGVACLPVCLSMMDYF